MEARIYRPAKTAMQSGRAKTRRWRLEFEPAAASRRIDSLMGWTGSTDTSGQVSLGFDSREAAEAFCHKHGIAYRVQEPHEPKPRIKSYADNFRYGRVT